VAHILIAEDEDSVRELILRALAADGHRVAGCADGAAALDILAAAQEPFDLLLTDIKMPVMDGIALALAAARDWPAMPVLLMTGYADQRERATGLEAIVRSVLAKPFTLAELRFAVAAALAAGP
jgi:two-component system, cell cycle response regulator CpdR